MTAADCQRAAEDAVHPQSQEESLPHRPHRPLQEVAHRPQRRQWHRLGQLGLVTIHSILFTSLHFTSLHFTSLHFTSLHLTSSTFIFICLSINLTSFIQSKQLHQIKFISLNLTKLT